METIISWIAFGGLLLIALGIFLTLVILSVLNLTRRLEIGIALKGLGAIIIWVAVSFGVLAILGGIAYGAFSGLGSLPDSEEQMTNASNYIAGVTIFVDLIYGAIGFALVQWLKPRKETQAFVKGCV